ncbi:uncharacterized protein LOC128858542 [Anastrepha ludens]|uniref:uncharacterized protein LOC128858542 n=1 Tax=Anastrepha ludens TaxID=28586 RepID=UPI0023B04EE8|nr:uncharacterized protein LOC128858542 [Anastrepha ludens]
MFRYCVYVCLLALAAAQNGGYNYASASAPEPQVFIAPPDPAPAPVSSTSNTQYVADVPVVAASQQQIQQAAPASVQYKYRKDFYYFKAPAASVAQRPVAQASQPVPTVQKQLNVVVIKAPESSKSHYQQPLRNAVPQVVEETKTHIYVLSKEPGRSAPKPAASQQQHVTTHKSHKPEVHYLKYKTPAEAQQIQQQIVQQYGGGNIVDLSAKVAASNVNRQYLAPAASNGNTQNFSPAASNVNIQYLAPAASNVNRQYLAPAASNGNIQTLAPSASNVNTQTLAPAASNVNSQYLAPSASNVNTQTLAPAASNVNTQYLPPAVSNVNAEYLPPSSEPSNAYISPRFFFRQ